MRDTNKIDKQLIELTRAQHIDSMRNIIDMLIYYDDDNAVIKQIRKKLSKINLHSAKNDKYIYDAHYMLLLYFNKSTFTKHLT